MSDHCNCPLPSLPDFISASCPAPLRQMEADLAPWAGGVDMKVAVTKARETFKYAGSQCWCHYAVKDGEVWRRCYGQQGCISCGTCSYLELTEDHVLTSAYVKIFRIITRNAVNKSF